MENLFIQSVFDHRGNYRLCEVVFDEKDKDEERMLTLCRKPGFKIFRSAKPGEIELTINLKPTKF
jgi:hypothetical protein